LILFSSCTNGRIEDFRAFTEIVKGKKPKTLLRLVPGSHVVEAQIKEEGLLEILTEAGFVYYQDVPLA
jgi:3-isopropylmalate/(R)-2-methylmalate dehydratase large subunit